MKRRSTPLSVLLLRWYFRHAASWLPGSTLLAYRLWRSTIRFPWPAREQLWNQQARLSYHPCQPHRIAVYSWGEAGNPVIMLLHGWNGRATQLGAFAVSLAKAGFHVVAMDAPAHGRSTGHHTDFYQWVACINCLRGLYGDVYGVIAHSYGVSCITYMAATGALHARRMVFISGPKDLMSLVHYFSRAVHLPASIQHRLQSKMEHHFGADIWHNASADQTIAGVGVPCLIVHDSQDKDVPIDHACRLHAAAPHSQCVQTQGLGHTRILRDAEVVKRVVEFMAKPVEK